MAKNINNEVFDESTRLKLSIFGDCFEEWFPVFLHSKYVDKIVVFDFFAGSGTDAEGTPGSPLVLVKHARGEDCKYCKAAKKDIHFIFNERLKRKSETLSKNVAGFFDQCRHENSCEACTYTYKIEQNDFKTLFDRPDIQEVLNDKKTGKFVLLDQYGFKEIDDSIFSRLTAYPKTDFVFFVSSSNIKRFKEQMCVRKYLKTESIKFDDTKPNECHRVIAEYFRRQVKGEYFIHHFSIKKGSNYWGLIFGTGHSLGMEKFLKTCWKHDCLAGESNFNINNDFEEDSLFFDPKTSSKKALVSKEIEALVCSGEISDNISGLMYAMKRGCEPKVFTETIKRLEKCGRVVRIGNLNYSSSNIHNLKNKQYRIRVLEYSSTQVVTWHMKKGGLIKYLNLWLSGGGFQRLFLSSLST